VVSFPSSLLHLEPRQCRSAARVAPETYRALGRQVARYLYPSRISDDQRRSREAWAATEGRRDLMTSRSGGWIVTRHELAHLAVALKALPENKTKSLEDLALEACRFLLYCQNVLEDVDSNYSKWHLPQNREALKKLSKPETARLVTGQKRRDRAVAWFDRF